MAKTTGTGSRAATRGDQTRRHRVAAESAEWLCTGRLRMKSDIGDGSEASNAAIAVTLAPSEKETANDRCTCRRSRSGS